MPFLNFFVPNPEETDILLNEDLSDNEVAVRLMLLHYPSGIPYEREEARRRRYGEETRCDRPVGPEAQSSNFLLVPTSRRQRPSPLNLRLLPRCGSAQVSPASRTPGTGSTDRAYYADQEDNDDMHIDPPTPVVTITDCEAGQEPAGPSSQPQGVQSAATESHAADSTAEVPTVGHDPERESPLPGPTPPIWIPRARVGMYPPLSSPMSVVESDHPPARSPSAASDNFAESDSAIPQEHSPLRRQRRCTMSRVEALLLFRHQQHQEHTAAQQHSDNESEALSDVPPPFLPMEGFNRRRAATVAQAVFFPGQPTTMSPIAEALAIEDMLREMRIENARSRRALERLSAPESPVLEQSAQRNDGETSTGDGGIIPGLQPGDFDN
ncbi:hypothetical protein BDY21DRAFT_371692 [Lineolata rhizophorae]|uniref:Uncharacterized protein n=1 Tax=Lineolata rhizophorae TaxID=578093 RepID=A0A6A6P0M3_9PEZI|nr:hypothetical protein BDY21DRAFT_371692 [Lineolata rhizophorae]